MNYCEGCIHYDVCGEEGAREESLTFCDDKISDPYKVLDKIRAEIQKIDDYRVVNGGMYVRESDVVKIIDKYRKEKVK